MKKIGLLFICLISSFSLSSQVKIGIAAANQYAERWIKEVSIMKKVAKELGEEVIIEIARDDAQKQFEQSQKLIDNGIKVLIIIPVDGNDAARIVDYAQQKGTKVVAYDRLILESNLDLYITFNSIMVGELITTHLIKKVPSGNYIFINGPEADFNTSLIKKGVMNILKPKLNSSIKLIFDKNLNEWSDVEAYMLMNELLAEKKIPNAIITASDIIGIGVIQAYEDNAIEPVPIVGQDADLLACKAMMEDKYYATILKKPEIIATKAAKIAVSIANNTPLEKIEHYTNNGKIDVPSILLEPILITKKNLEKEVINSGFLTKESIFEK